jgi:hypothetical protein
VDEGLIALDLSVEKNLEPFGCSRPREPLSQEPTSATHLLGQLTIRQQPSDSLRVSRRVVLVDEVSADLIAHNRAQPRHA